MGLKKYIHYKHNMSIMSYTRITLLLFNNRPNFTHNSYNRLEIGEWQMDF